MCTSLRGGEIDGAERGGKTSPEKKSSTELSCGFLPGLEIGGVEAVSGLPACAQKVLT